LKVIDANIVTHLGVSMDWMLDLLTQLGTLSNYRVIADLYTLQTTKKGKVVSVTGCVSP
jgi:hypothetical protein